jgi:hypothetical protein
MSRRLRPLALAPAFAHGCRSGLQKPLAQVFGVFGRTRRAVANRAHITHTKLSGHKAPGSARFPRPCSGASYQTGRRQAPVELYSPPILKGTPPMPL